MLYTVGGQGAEIGKPGIQEHAMNLRSIGMLARAALAAALEIAARDDSRGKMIVVLLADTGERYVTTKLFARGATTSDVDSRSPVSVAKRY